MVSEFMALANRISGLKHEVTAFIEESRRIQARVLARALSTSDVRDGICAEGLALLATSAALALSREAALGISAGHDNLLKVIARFVELVEPTEADRRDDQHKAGS